MSTDPTFISRWSRRKKIARQELDDAKDADNIPPVAEESPTSEPEKDEAEILAELGLKDPDEMGKDDDFSVFMKSAVPAKLRNRALRKLWLSNPTLANIDNLVEYGEDYTQATSAAEKIVTAYKIGKGFLKPSAENTEDEDVAPDSAPHPEEQGNSDAEIAELSEIHHDEPLDDMAVSLPEGAGHGDLDSDDPPPPRRQRMVFRF